MSYYCGIGVGFIIGYCLSLITLITMWGLCVVAHNVEEEGQFYEEKKNTAEK